jgi:plasmid maintenance system antidote protein VapI
MKPTPEEEVETKRFLDTVKTKMTENNVSQGGLERATGMSSSHVYAIMTGKVGITLKTICRFAKVFGVEPYELLK